MSHATAEDLRMNENVILSQEDMKSLQVKVPVVATITQKMDANGKFSYLVESSNTDDENGMKIKFNLLANFLFKRFNMILIYFLLCLLCSIIIIFIKRHPRFSW